jgi:hypothetical protein
MADTCTIRPVDGVTTDPDTGVVSPAYGDPVYSGRCKLQQMRGSFPSTPEGGEHRWSVGPLEVHLPVAGTAGVAVGHVVEVAESFDPDNVGRVFRVRGGDRKTFATAVRFQVEEVLD